MHKAFNSPDAIVIKPAFTKEQVASWNNDAIAWKTAAEAHLRELGLDPAEFLRLIVDSFSLRSTIPAKERALEEHENFLPPRTQGNLEKKDIQDILGIRKIETKVCEPKTLKKNSIFERTAETFD
jgi:antitoxin component of RelBE/YafQ-DinJ toxin-antitoxin module